MLQASGQAADQRVEKLQLLHSAAQPAPSGFVTLDQVLVLKKFSEL